MLDNNKYALLQLFADGGDGGAGATSNGATADGMLATSNKNPLANVQYGKQVNDVNTESQNANGVDKATEFDKLIKGEYKEFYDAKVKDTINKRFKSQQESVDNYNKVMPMLEKLGSKYGVDYKDIDALEKAMDEDDSYYEDEALERGLTVEQLKHIKKIEKENAEFKKQMDESKRKENADRLYAQWINEEQNLKKTYPNFNLQSELKNPQFANLIQNNTSLEAAYIVCHYDEILPSAMKFAVNQTSQKVANSIMANGQRPIENGQANKSPSMFKDDVSQLTRADRMEINRRVARGEKITF